MPNKIHSYHQDILKVEAMVRGCHILSERAKEIVISNENSAEHDPECSAKYCAHLLDIHRKCSDIFWAAGRTLDALEDLANERRQL